MNGLPKLKYVKDQLCLSCKLGKAKKSSFKTKTVSSSKGRLHLLHMDLCGPMCVESINEKKYIMVIVDDYSRYMCTHFLRSKDETPKVLIDFLKLIQRSLQAQVITVLTDKGTKSIAESIHINFDEIKELTMMCDDNTLGLAPQLQRTSDHNRSEFGIQDYSNEPSSSKLVPNVVPTTDMTDPSLQELELLFSLINPSKPVQTRRQLATDPEMCMFTLTVSTAEPKNIKEAIVDHVWIKAMQEE
ncbi:retrovirus-related pol polyprotein from transposon TNT 1-94 [Tanacetum coccineum]